MYKQHRIAVIIPAYNEEEAIPPLIPRIPSYVDTIIVADNGSMGHTRKIVEDSKWGERVISPTRIPD